MKANLTQNHQILSYVLHYIKGVVKSEPSENMPVKIIVICYNILLK